MHFDLNIAIIAVLTSGVGYLMVVAGLQKSALERKRSRRVCTSCGREIHHRVCSNCASA